MTAVEQLKRDVTSAMKAGERERVGALRLVLSELQKAEKEGRDDEQAVLRRERKRRQEAAAQYREAGRAELAEQEESEAALIEAYLPAQLSEEELGALVSEALAESGAASPKDMGKVMPLVMERVRGRADGRRVSARVREELAARA